ncbi:MAG: glycosyltransferase [Acholeplasma sp.]|nr:MAG: glycosyltransferase [Acholeplasma sp.]
MKTLANLIPYIRPLHATPTHGNMNYGVLVACSELNRNLCQYGTWDEYHIVNMYEDPCLVEKSWNESIQDPDLRARIHLINSKEFMDNLQNETYALILEGECFLQATALRCLMKDKVPPICGHTHTISYNFLANSLFTAMMNPTRSWDGIICTTPTAKTVMQNLIQNLKESAKNQPWNMSIDFSPQMKVIPLGVDINRYKPRDKHAIREKYLIPKDAFVFLYLGRISKQDKMDIIPMILLLKSLLEETNQSNLLFCICGNAISSAYLSQLKNIIHILELERHIRIIQTVLEHEKPLLYNLADLFISFSDNIQETFGLTVLEAMASGLPLLTSDWDGYKFLVDNDINGYKIPTIWMKSNTLLHIYCNLTPWSANHYRLSQSLAVDSEYAIQILKQLLMKQDSLIDMGVQSRRKACTQFSWPCIIEQLEQFWDELISNYTNYKQTENRYRHSITNRIFIDEFRQYPSRFIQDNDRIYLTKFGANLYKNKTFLPILLSKQMFSYIDENEFMIVFNVLKDLEGLSIKEIAERITPAHNIQEAIVVEILMFLVKYNIFTI